jgi:putative transposase
MTNHVHFATFPQNERALARTFGLAHMRYSQYFNRQQGHVGHLWQERFFTSLLDDAYLMRAARYIECNPVRAGLVTDPAVWPWSSAAVHVRGDRLPGARWPDDDTLKDWREYLQTPEDPADLAILRAAAITGRPVGRVDYLTALEAQVGHALLTRPRGRPRKEDK